MAGNSGAPQGSPVVAQLVISRHANGMYSLSAPNDLDIAYVLLARANELLHQRVYESKKPASSLVVPQILPPGRL